MNVVEDMYTIPRIYLFIEHSVGILQYFEHLKIYRTNSSSEAWIFQKFLIILPLSHPLSLSLSLSLWEHFNIFACMSLLLTGICYVHIGRGFKLQVLLWYMIIYRNGIFVLVLFGHIFYHDKHLDESKFSEIYSQK